MNYSILKILACPICKSNLYFSKKNQILICKLDKLSYKIYKNIPKIMIEKAQKLTLKELKKYIN